MRRVLVCLATALLMFAADLEARQRSVRSPSLPGDLDAMTLRSVELQFGSVDLSPGQQLTLRLWKWECCVIPREVEARVRFSMDANDYATLDPVTGRLTISPAAPGGLSFRVYADVEEGRRIVSADVHVDTPETNPLRGYWREVATIPCADSTAPFNPYPIRELHFRGDRTFSVTWIPFEVYKDYWGFYAFDKPAGRLTLGIRHGNHVPDGFRGDGTFAITTVDGRKRLTVTGVSFGRRDRDQSSVVDCGAVFEQ
jgi:hypothetical protein